MPELSWLRGRTSKKQLAEVRASDRAIFTTMLIFGIFGLIAAFVLSVEKIHLLQNPNAQLSCSFNLIFNCATVMKTPQASVFGFPNSYIGLMGYPLVIFLAVAGLARTRFGQGFLRAAQIGFGFGLIFAYWLFFQSVFIIQVLCPWCLVVTFSTTIIFMTLLRYNLRENTFSFSRDMHKRVLSWLAADYDKLLTASWSMLMVALVLIQFRDGLFG